MAKTVFYENKEYVKKKVFKTSCFFFLIFQKTGLSAKPKYPENRELSETIFSWFFPEIKFPIIVCKKKSTFWLTKIWDILKLSFWKKDFSTILKRARSCYLRIIESWKTYFYGRKLLTIKVGHFNTTSHTRKTNRIEFFRTLQTKIIILSLSS